MRRTTVGFAAVSFLTISSFATADDYFWTSPVSGNFSTPGNWTPSGPPGSTDTANFNTGSTAGYSVSTALPQGSNVGQLLVDNDTVTLTGFGLSAASTTAPGVLLGNNAGDIANLQLNTSLSGNQIWVGAQPGAQATLTLGLGDTLLTVLPTNNAPPALVVGAGGTGTLTVHGTANVGGALLVGRDAGSQGTISINGSHSMLQSATTGFPVSTKTMTSAIVGQSGQGALSVTAGGTANIPVPLVIGQNAGSQGIVSFDGSQSTATFSSGVTVGQSGSGSLSFTSDVTAVINGALMVGQNAGSQGTINISGSDLGNVAGATLTSATIGASGQGSLSMAADATLKLSGSLVIGQGSTSTSNSVSVDGNDTTLTTLGSGVTVGQGGIASLSITNGGTVSMKGALSAGQNAGAQGTISVTGAGSSLTSNTMTSATIGDVGQGSLSVAAGGTAKLDGPLVIGQSAHSQGTVNVDGLHSLLEPAGSSLNLSLTVGGAGQGSMSLTGGATALLGAAITVGRDAGAQGALTLDGSGSALKSYGSGSEQITSLNVGASGIGTFSVTNGGLATIASPVVVGINAGSQGTVAIDGSNSQLSFTTLSVGQSGNGALSITGGGLAKATSTSVVGQNAGSQGSVTVSGSQSKLTAMDMTIGQDGTGTLSASGGATINARSANVGFTTSTSSQTGSGTMSLDGAGTSLILSSGDVTVGHQTTGSVSVTNGATVSGSHLTIGDQLNGIGSVTIDGANSVWNSVSIITVGHGGTGSLTVSNGAQVTTNIANTDFGSRIDIEGGTLTTLQLTTFGTLINNGTINGNVIVGSGTVSGTGTFANQLSLSNATISPGNSPGTMIVGSAVLNSGVFRLEINSAGGTAGGSIGWDLLKDLGPSLMTGNITLDVVSLTPANAAGNLFDFDPTSNYQWTFLIGPLGIGMLNSAQFVVDTSAFANPFTGHFFVSQVGGNTVLNYVVPEPSTIVLAALAVAGLLAVRRRTSPT